MHELISKCFKAESSPAFGWGKGRGEMELVKRAMMNIFERLNLLYISVGHICVCYFYLIKI